MEMMMVQAYLNTDNVEAASGSPETVKEFKELLKFAQECLEKDSCEQKKEDIDVLLIELLNLLNISMLLDNMPDNLIDAKELSSFNNILSDFDTLEKTNISSLLSDLLTELKETGHIEEANVDRFYEVLKAKIPEMEQVDLDGFRSSVIELLETQFHKVKKTNSINIDEPEGVKPEMEEKEIKVKDLDSAYKPTFEIDEKKLSRPKITGYNREVKSLSQDPDPFIKLQQTKDVFSNLNPIPADNVIELIDSERTPQFTHTPNLLELKDETVVFDQIVDKVKLLAMGENQQISIKLKPEHLGQVIVKVIAEKDRLRAEFFVGNTQVKEMLNVHAQEFKNQIQEQGYNFSDISVYDLSDTLNHGSFNHHFQDDNNKQHKKTKYIFKSDVGNIGEISSEDYYDPWQVMSNVDFRA